MGLFKPNINKMEERKDANALIKALATKDDLTRREAAAALGRMRDRSGVEPLIQALSDTDKFVRVQAIIALGKIGDVRALDPLIDILTTGNSGYEVSEAIGRLGDVRAIPPLVKALRDKDQYVRFYAAMALTELDWEPEKNEAGAFYWIAHRNWNECVELGEVAVEPLIRAFNDQRSYQDRIAIVITLGEIGDPRAVETLVKGLVNKYHEHYTDVELQRIADQNAAELHQQINHAFDTIRFDGASIRYLLGLIKDPDHDTRLYAAQVLERTNWNPRDWEGESIQSSIDYWLLRSNFSEITSMGEPAVKFLIAALNEKKATLQYSHDDRIFENHIAGIIKTLHSLLVEHEAWKQCRELQESGIENIIKVLSNPDLENRKTAASFLVHLYKFCNKIINDRLLKTILSSRERIIAPHCDEPTYSGQCYHHEDSGGIGLNFPL